MSCMHIVCLSFIIISRYSAEEHLPSLTSPLSVSRIFAPCNQENNQIKYNLHMYMYMNVRACTHVIHTVKVTYT
jgi:hypothetical protein